MNIKADKENLTLSSKRIISGIAIALFLIFCSVVGWFIGRPMISFVSEPEKFRLWVESHGIMGDVAFVGMVIFQVVIAFVPGEPLEIGAGYAFGAIEGAVLCMIGTAIGSVIVFMLVKKFGIKLLEVFFKIEKIKSLKFLQNTKRVNIIIFLIFFLPGTPKDLVTYFVGLTDIKPKYFLLLASIVRLPSIITSTLGGDALGVEKYSRAIIVFSVTVVISLLGLLCYNLIIKLRDRRERNA